jgi:hypothetical protein
MKTRIHTDRLRRFGALALLATVAAVAGCDEQLGPGLDRRAPTVTVLSPEAGAIVTLGDSVRVEVRARDNQALRNITIGGYAGEPRAPVSELEPIFSRVDIPVGGDLVTDTVVTAYLHLERIPTRGPIFIRVVAHDREGNWMQYDHGIQLSTARVEILNPQHRSAVSSGTQLPVRLRAGDMAGAIGSLVLRATGATPERQVITFPMQPAEVDTTIMLSIPVRASADSVVLQAIAITSAGDSIQSPRTVVGVQAAAADTEAPRVTMSVGVLTRTDLTDSLTVSVSATDNTKVDSVGVTVFAVVAGAGKMDTLAMRSRSVGGEAGTFRFPIMELNGEAILSRLLRDDSVTVSFEVTAFAVDTARARNCGSAVASGMAQSLPCAVGPQGARVSTLPAAPRRSLVTRGMTVRLGNSGDRIADIVSDGRRVFLSNMSRNRLEVMNVGGRTFSAPIAVGSEPWGLALAHGGDSLFVANSGGTNISVVALNGATPREVRRIFTPDVRIYDVQYDIEKDSVNNVVRYDYSDRPQFLAHLRTGQIVYSTRPTTARADGTVRIYDPTKDVTYAAGRATEVFTGYAEEATGRAIAVNALYVRHYTDKTLTVCPRRLLASGEDPPCINGGPTTVSHQLRALAAQGLTDTRLDLYAHIGSIGLQDTTFVAVSKDHSTVVIGEGAAQYGRIMRFETREGGLVGSTRETHDLIGNMADRVVGLGLNGDGSLGIARGTGVYYFDSQLRLQGTSSSDQPAGGVALHPSQVGYPNVTGTTRASFVSGMGHDGIPYIDVIDAYSFCRTRRIYIRDRVTGGLISVAPVAGDAASIAMRLYALTESGVVELVLQPGDLVGSCG